MFVLKPIKLLLALSAAVGLAWFSDIKHLDSYVEKLQDINYNNYEIRKRLPHDKKNKSSNVTSLCFPFNSQEWLEGPRIGNSNGDVRLRVANRFLLEDASTILEQNRLGFLTGYTMCHDQSGFRSFQQNVSHEQLVDQWHSRLVYLAIHHYHHAPASEEAKARRNCSKARLFDHDYPPIGAMDYECPKAKFLVTAVPSVGFGASFRLGAVRMLLTGLALNRITIFVNGANVGPDFLQEDWPIGYGACNDRSDAQCFFLPTTPCTLTEQELRNATVLEEKYARAMRQQGVLPSSDLNTQRVLVMTSRLGNIVKRSFNDRVQRRLHQVASHLVEHYKQQAGSVVIPPGLSEVWDEALKRIQNPIPTRRDSLQEGLYDYKQRFDRTPHVALMYLLRPRRALQKKMDEVINGEILPKGYDPNLAIGLPIRGSDKCSSESTCLPFERYMELVNTTWKTHFPPDVPMEKGSVVLTTEDKAVMDWATNSSAIPLVCNPNDVLQGTGSPKRPQYKHSAASVMFSTLVALRLQLRTRFVVGNCCSNFHLLVFDLLDASCGLPQQQSQCLQEHENPDFHVCCAWTNTPECHELRNQKRS